MSFDFESHLTAVERCVLVSERDGKPSRGVAISRSLDVAVEDLWDAVTNGERIRQWFSPISGDLEQGGRYQVEGNAGGEITSCKRLSYFALTWEFAGDVSWVEVSLTNDGYGCVRLTLSHISLHSEHWDTYGPGATGVGWEMGLMGLALHVEQPGTPMPDETEFATSAEGRAYIAGSSEAWAVASVDAGADTEAAMAAARRTAAFYTGENLEE